MLPFRKHFRFGEVDYFGPISDLKMCSNHLMLDISQTTSYEITHVCLTILLSVCLSIRLSLSFLRIGSLVFADIVHDDSWPWYLVTDEARFLKKMAAQIWAKWTKIGPETRFFDSLVSLEIAYNDSLEQFLTTSRDKTCKKFGSNGSKFPQLGFFVIFSSLVH